MFDEDDISREREDKARLQQKRREDDFLWLMNDVRGRRFIWDTLSESCMFHSTFDTHGGRMSLNEGRRQVGLKLLAQIHALCPLLYPVMVTENTVKPEDTGEDR